MIFPTRFKGKISADLSYPVGAELISSELANMPQAGHIDITFRRKYQRLKTRGEPYPIFAVSYVGARADRSAWGIEVGPVSRILKPKVREALTHECFPIIRRWLGKYAGVDSRYGTHSLSVILDETGETFLKLEEYHSPGEAFSNRTTTE